MSSGINDGYAYAKCRLDNNHRVTEYHAACQIGNRPYNPEIFKYIGDGVIFSIEGKRFNGEMRLSFFAVIKKPKRKSDQR